MRKTTNPATASIAAAAYSGIGNTSAISPSDETRRIATLETRVVSHRVPETGPILGLAKGYEIDITSLLSATYGLKFNDHLVMIHRWWILADSPRDRYLVLGVFVTLNSHQRAQTTQTKCAPQPADLGELRRGILEKIGTAIEATARRAQEQADGLSNLSEQELKLTLALFELLPRLLPLLQSSVRPREYDGPPLIPICPVCGEGPGAHWPDSCPKNPNAKYKPPAPLPKR